MKCKSLFFLCAFVPLWLKIAFAVDHTNLDAGRPLEFDDAYSVAYREQSLEIGGALAKPARGKIGASGSMEYFYGFAKNSHLAITFDPQYSSEDNGARRFDFGDASVGLFHNFNREYGNTPALAIRLDASLPTGRNSSGVSLRARAIASKKFGARGKLHLNLDGIFSGSSRSEERKFQPGAILGYSQLLGYPRRFDRTFVTQLGWRANSLKNDDGVTTIGVGMRQQVGVQSVFDIGVLSDLTGGDTREKLKLAAGYSTQF
jgi:hypothetical protein